MADDWIYEDDPEEDEPIDYRNSDLFPEWLKERISGYTLQGAVPLDPYSANIVALWTNLDEELPAPEVQAMIDSLVIGGAILDFSAEIEEARSYFLMPQDLPETVKLKPMPSVADAIIYLSGIGGWQTFGGVTWINGTWFVWIGES